MTIHRPITDTGGRNFSAHPGLEVDLEPEQAVRLIQAGQAEAVAEAAEAAVSETGETAVLPAAKKVKRS